VRNKETGFNRKKTVLIYSLSTIIAHVEFNVFTRTADSGKQ